MIFILKQYCFTKATFILKQRE